MIKTPHLGDLTTRTSGLDETHVIDETKRIVPLNRGTQVAHAVGCSLCATPVQGEIRAIRSMYLAGRLVLVGLSNATDCPVIVPFCCRRGGANSRKTRIE